METQILKISEASSLDKLAWEEAHLLKINQYHPKSSEHRPEVEARLLYSDQNLFVQFKVFNDIVRSHHQGYQVQVCEDSCVEIFIEPPGRQGYVNFEFNATGAMLTYHIKDARRTDTGFEDYVVLPESQLHEIDRHCSLKGKIDPDVNEKQSWTLSVKIPWSFFNKVFGISAPSEGDTWRANLYKCGDQTGFPHFGSWSNIGEKLNFHQPDRFGEIRFI